MGDTRREQLAALPFAEKLRILDKLRARSLAIAAAGWRGSESKTEDETSGSQDDKGDESK